MGHRVREGFIARAALVGVVAALGCNGRAPLGKPDADVGAEAGAGHDAAAAQDAPGKPDGGVDRPASLDGGPDAPPAGVTQTLPEEPTRKLDLLFMVDNSRSMLPLQARLTREFPVLIQTLQALPAGLPDLHIGVVSSSMGAGPNDVPDIQSCPRGGDGGRLRTPSISVCPDKPSDRYIIAGGAFKNYPTTIEKAFTCLASLGDEGCGFEHQLESLAAALGIRRAAPVENTGFLRPDAALGLVLITNEDDCSAPPDTDLFSTASQLITDPVGPLQSYRCNEFGHLCGGLPPPRTTAATLTSCESNENGKLFKVADYVTAFQALKPAPGLVFVAAIAGPPSPYVVRLVPSTNLGDPTPWPLVEHSCVAANAPLEYSDPAVRIDQFVRAFGADGSFSSICDDFAPALGGLATSMTRAMGPRCLSEGVVAKAATPTLRPGCTVVEDVVAAGGQSTQTPLAACGATPAACWAVKVNAACAGSGAEITIARPTFAPAGALLRIRCP
jgi:hypothetical protein